MTAPVLSVAGRVVPLTGRPLLMGIVNATPDSFSDGRGTLSLGERLEHARSLLAAGADILDVGGESARGDRPAVPADEEIGRVLPLVERLAGEGALVSVDTHKPSVAEAAVAAGAAIVNDVSGLRDLGLADVCARSGAALVVMHTRVEPKGTLLDPGALRGRRRGRGGVPARADRRRRRPRRGRGADPRRPRPGLREDARADRRGAAAARRGARARPPRAARGLAQGLRRRAHRPRARPSAAPARSRRSPTASTPAPTCCGSTTSPPPRTTSRSAPPSAASASWPDEGLHDAGLLTPGDRLRGTAPLV